MRATGISPLIEKMNTFKLKTLGCKVNQYESQEIREALLKNGFSEKNNGQKADFYVVNTCTVTERSDSKSLSLIREAIKENKIAKILVAGCFAKANQKAIKKIFGDRIIFNNHFKKRFIKQKNSISTSATCYEGISDFKGHSRAFIKIQDGCNNHCAYCKVPLVRGNSHSRNLKSLKQEALRLINKGFKELVLCGICLGDYGKDLNPKIHLSDVILSLLDIKKDFRIRLSSIEAKDVTGDIIEIMSNTKRLCPHLHIPFQSGDNFILKRMNRHYRAEEYLNIVDKIRSKIPLVAITTDIMLGFPGESEKNFENTVKFLKQVKPSRIHCFPFSPRPGTAAYNFREKVSDDAVDKRMSVVLNLAKEMSYNYQRRFINKELEVLVESRPDKKTGFSRGYSENYIYTLADSKNLTPGKIIKVKARSVNSHYLCASVLCSRY